MCECPPIDLMCAAVGKLGRVPPGMVEAIYGRLERDGDKAGRLTAPMLAAAFRWRPHMVERAVEAMKEFKVLSEAGVVTEAWRNGETLRRDAVAPALRHAPMSGAGRSARWRKNHPEHVEIRRDKRLSAAVATQRNEPASQPLRHPSSLSLFEDDLPEKEQKQTRVHGETVTPAIEREFEAWVEGYPIEAPEGDRGRIIADARNAYASVSAKASATELIAARDAYIGSKEGWRATMYPARFLRSWRRPALALGAPPREVASTDPPKPKIDWIALGEAWVTTRQWPPDVGPPPDKDTCLMPFGWMQRFRRALIDRHSGERVSA